MGFNGYVKVDEELSQEGYIYIYICVCVRVCVSVNWIWFF